MANIDREAFVCSFVTAAITGKKTYEIDRNYIDHIVQMARYAADEIGLKYIQDNNNINSTK